MTAIAAAGVGRRYGDHVALRDVSFEVAVGEVVALLGPNGAGKTTTIEILEGFLAPTAGSVTVLGTDPRAGDRRWRSRIGLVLQSTSLDAQLTARETLQAFAAVYPAPLPVPEVLDRVELAHRARTPVGRLSDGQRRRVDLGVGIIGRPELLFLDEPTTGLDPAARRRTWAIVRDLATSGTTVLLSTHYMEEAEQLAQRVLVLSSGVLMADATPSAIRSGASRLSAISLPVATADNLPRALREHFDPELRALVLTTDDVAGTLDALLRWSRDRGADLGGLQIGPPSLEDAYLNLVREDTHV